MKFATPCFVRVENVEERRQLVKWLVDIGYRIYHNHPNPDSIVTDGSWGGVYLGRWARVGKIDCGENIELFKALAAMNDENYNEQYFVTELAGSSYCVHKNRNTNLDYSLVCRKATVAEIVEYFKSTEE